MDRLRAAVELYVRAYARPEAERSLKSSFAELRAATSEGKRRLDALRRLFTAFRTSQLKLSGTASRLADRSADHSLIFAGAGALLSLLLLLGLAAYVLTRVLRPVRQVAASADRLASGEREVRASERGGGEIGSLGRSFNEMASALWEREDERVGATNLADACQALESADVELAPAASAAEQAWRATEPPLRHRLARRGSRRAGGVPHGPRSRGPTPSPPRRSARP